MKRASVFLLLVFSLVACSIPPDNPVTREQLMRTQIYNKYVIEESPEQVLNVLNREGEVILEGKRNIPGRNILVHVKLLATSEGIEISEYER